MSVSFVDRNAVSRLWIDARVLSTVASAPSRGVQAESLNDSDAAIRRLRICRLHEERYHRTAAEAYLHPAVLFVGLARAVDLFLDFPQHPLVSVRFVSLRSPTVREDIYISETSIARVALPYRASDT